MPFITVIVLSGCTAIHTTKLRIATPYIVNPVSLSSVVSVNKKRETDKIGEITATASETEIRTKYVSGVQEISKEEHKSSDDIETSIVKKLEGDEAKAINNVKITVIFDVSGAQSSHANFSTFGRIDGNVIKVK